jgi:hypothetical protein
VTKPSDIEQQMRLEKMFRQAFGRSISLEERKFLGLSAEMYPISEDEPLAPPEKEKDIA